MDRYDVVIVGGGVVGAALLYTLSNYTDIKKIALVEKRGSIASLNSDWTSNSQTLHFGDVETNYNEETARRTKEASKLILGYQKSENLYGSRMIKKCQKLLLAVGDEEIAYAEKWYKSFARRLYAGLDKIDAETVKKIEPNLLKGRDGSEKIAVYRSETGYMVDYGRLARSFVKKSKVRAKKIDLMLNVGIDSFSGVADGYILNSGDRTIICRAVVFATGAYSLYFAKMIGIAENFSIIATGGGFFRSRKVLNGKVYRVQMGKIPFAAVHGDPDMNDSSVTRFGPVIYLPIGMEKGEFRPLDYARTSGAEELIPTSLRISGKYNLFSLISRHLSYSIPFIGKELFLKNEARKLVPSLKYSDISAAEGYGGISPRIVDRRSMTLNIGEQKIRKGNAIFNVSPSPGASSSLAIAESDAKYLSKRLGFRFDQDKFNRNLRRK